MLVVSLFTSRDFSLNPGLGHSENEFGGLHPSGLLSTMKNHHTILHNWKFLLKRKPGLEFQRSLQVETEVYCYSYMENFEQHLTQRSPVTSNIN